MTSPSKVPAASDDPSAVTVSVAGALVPDDFTVSHGTSVVAVNGTVFPVPIAVTCTDCDAGVCELPATPLNVNAVGETWRTGLLVTTRVTGIVVTDA